MNNTSPRFPHSFCTGTLIHDKRRPVRHTAPLFHTYTPLSNLFFHRLSPSVPYSHTKSHCPIVHTDTVPESYMPLLYSSTGFLHNTHTTALLDAIFLDTRVPDSAAPIQLRYYLVRRHHPDTPAATAT